MRLPVVGDHNQGVDILAQGFDAVNGLLCTAAAFKGKRVGHHTHGQDASLARDAGNHRGSTSTSATTHTSSDKHLDSGDGGG